MAISGEDKGKDDLAGVSAEDTGMTPAFIGPELSYTWQEHLNAELGAEFPLVNDNTDLQLCRTTGSRRRLAFLKCLRADASSD